MMRPLFEQIDPLEMGGHKRHGNRRRKGKAPAGIYKNVATQENVREHHMTDDGFAGDAWTWVVVDADATLIHSWMLGRRYGESARNFTEDLARRLAKGVRLATAGLKAYPTSVDTVFGEEIDCGQLHRVYGSNEEGQVRHSPAVRGNCENIPPATRPRNAYRPAALQLFHSYVDAPLYPLDQCFSKKIEDRAASLAN